MSEILTLPPVLLLPCAFSHIYCWLWKSSFNFCTSVLPSLCLSPLLVLPAPAVEGARRGAQQSSPCAWRVSLLSWGCGAGAGLCPFLRTWRGLGLPEAPHPHGGCVHMVLGMGDAESRLSKHLRTLSTCHLTTESSRCGLQPQETYSCGWAGVWGSSEGWGCPEPLQAAGRI